MVANLVKLHNVDHPCTQACCCHGLRLGDGVVVVVLVVVELVMVELVVVVLVVVELVMVELVVVVLM